MEATIFQRIAENLRGRRDELLTWFGRSNPSEKALRLGPHSEEQAIAHIRELDSAIEKADREEIGECLVCHDTVETHLLEMDYSACLCITHLTPEEQNRLEAELELSRKVQRALLPERVPDIAGWEISAFSQPASIVGGDYFDFLQFDDGAPAIMIADVMGKGMPASMLMANLQATVRILVPEHHGPVEVLNRLNRLFRRNTSLTKFVTVFLARIDSASGRITYANAGHNPPLHIENHPAGVRTRTLMPTGPAIGLVADTDFQAREEDLLPGDTLVLYTDGVVEAKNSAAIEYGEQRLERLLLQHAGIATGQLIREIRREIAEFVGNAAPSDDITIIACARKA